MPEGNYHLKRGKEDETFSRKKKERYCKGTTQPPKIGGGGRWCGHLFFYEKRKKAFKERNGLAQLEESIILSKKVLRIQQPTNFLI